MYHDFCQSLCLRVSKFFVGQIFCVSGKIGYRKTLRIIRALHYYLLILFCSAVPKNFVRKHFGVSESFWFRKFFLMREVGVCHNFFPKFLPHSTEKNRRATLLCFRNFLVSKNVMDKRKGCCNTIFCHSRCLTVLKNFVGKPSFVSKTFGYRKVFMDERKGVCITIFCQSLCLRVPKFFVGQIFCVSGKIGYRKTLRIIRALHYYLMIFFCSAVPKDFVRKHFGVSENVWFRKFLLTREDGVCHDFFSKFLSQSTKKTRTGTLLCFRKKPVSKKRTVNKGTSLLSVDTFLFHSAKKTRAETVRCFRKYLVSQMFFDKRRGGCITIFCQSRCLTVPKIFVGKPSFVSKTFGYRKVLWIREEGGVSHFFVKIFDSQYRKMSLGNPSVFRKTRVSKIYMDKRRGDCITIFCRSLCLRVPKFFVGQTFCVSEKIGYRKKLRIIRGIHYYLLIFFCSTVPKKFVRKHFGVSESFWLRNFFWYEKRGFVTTFLPKSCLTVPKKFVDEPFCVSEKIRYRKILRIVMGLHYYLLIFFCSRVPKLFVPKHFGVSENVWFRKFFSDERRWGLSRFFFQVFVLQYGTNS